MSNEVDTVDDDDTDLPLWIKEMLASLVDEAEGQQMARKAHHQDLMAPVRIAEIGNLVAGTESGWQTRFAAATGVTRTHIANLVTGKRPATDDMRRAIAKAAEDAADDFERRAKELRKRAAKLRF